MCLLILSLADAAMHDIGATKFTKSPDGYVENRISLATWLEERYDAMQARLHPCNVELRCLRQSHLRHPPLCCVLLSAARRPCSMQQGPLPVPEHSVVCFLGPITSHVRLMYPRNQQESKYDGAQPSHPEHYAATFCFFCTWPSASAAVAPTAHPSNTKPPQ